MEYEVIDTQIAPDGRLEVLSKAEVVKLLDTSHSGLYQLFAIVKSAAAIEHRQRTTTKQLIKTAMTSVK